MATCMLCSSWVADDQSVCPRCGGAVDSDQAAGAGDAGSPWDAPTRVEERAAGGAWAPPAGPFGAQAQEIDPHWAPPAPGGWGYGTAPGYGAPAWGAPPVPFRPAPPIAGMATTAFVISLVSLVTAAFCGVTILGSPVGAVLGHLALRRIATTGEGGRGLALAAVILGWIGTALVLVGLAVVIAVVAAS